MFREQLSREFSPYGVLSNEQLDQLERHYSLLVRWNEKINLTRIRNLDEVVQFHYCESLFLGKALPPSPLQIVDVGSGAGFPGIPIAILRPDCTVHLVESNQRKAVFLREASRGLTNVRVLAQYADSVSLDCDWIVSRAVRVDEILALGHCTNVALLMSEEDAAKLPLSRAIEPLPWGQHRVIVTFHVEHDKIIKRG